MTEYDLVIHAPGAEPKRYPVNGQGLVIGRSADVDIIIEGKRVSRRHAKISTNGAGLIINYLGSRNGLNVNGSRVLTANLDEGDRFAIGDSVVIVARRNAAVSSADAVLENIDTPIPQRSRPAPRPAEESPDDVAYREIARIFSQSSSIPDLAKRILARMIESVQAKRGFLFSAQDDADVDPKIVAFQMDYRESSKDGLVLNRMIVDEVLFNGRKRGRSFSRSRSLRSAGDKGILCVPLMAKNKCVGVAYVDTPKMGESFNDAHHERLASLARAAGIALCRANRD